MTYIASEEVRLVSPKQQKRGISFPTHYNSSPMDLGCYIDTTLTSTGVGFIDNKIILATIPRYNHLRRQFILDAQEKLQRFKYIEVRGTTVLLIHNSWCPGYYHWITEALPRLLHALSYSRDFVLLYPSFLGTIQKDSLRVFNINRVFSYSYETNLKVQRLLLPTNTNYTGNYIPILILKLRSLYQNFISQRSEIGISLGSHLYISRRRAQRRHVINETEVIHFLSRAGYKSVCIEQFSFFEQISIMMNAEVIISLHGAGLTNMIFMNEGTKVLEFQKRPTGKSKFLNTLFFKLASICGLNYFYLLCKPVNPDTPLINADIIVDIPKLRNCLINYLT